MMGPVLSDSARRGEVHPGSERLELAELADLLCLAPTGGFVVQGLGQSEGLENGSDGFEDKKVSLGLCDRVVNREFWHGEELISGDRLRIQRSCDVSRLRQDLPY